MDRRFAGCRLDLFSNILQEDFSDPQLPYSTTEPCLSLFPTPADAVMNSAHPDRKDRISVLIATCFYPVAQ